MKPCPFRMWLLLLPLTLLMNNCASDMGKTPHHSAFDDYPVYTGADLGLTYTPERSVLKLYAPSARAARIRLYGTGLGGDVNETLAMEAGEDGVWTATLEGDWAGAFYAFQTEVNGTWGAAVPDPYAKAVGVNGQRAQILDLDGTDPAGWSSDRRPPLTDYRDIILYEIQVRDVSIHPSSGARHPGKFLALTETGTRSPEDLPTMLDHFRELGVTHVHLLPSFDFRSIDETLPEDERNYNWGYDPQNYNVPEGSFATDPVDPAARIREFKQMVQALHANGIRVILDVVYNHTGATEESLFNQLVPGYYYRQNDEGGFSNASACGNEVASERPMVRKFIVESMVYWAREYHLDGFRVDLMGIHDIETMNEAALALRRIDPTIFVYGEGWTAGGSPLPDSLRALKQNVPQMDYVAAFSDEVRDAIKGHVFTHDAPGFISGQEDLAESLKFGIVGGTEHPQLDYAAVNYTDAPWAPEPTRCIVYASCHDNHTLWDRLSLSRPDATEAERIRMDKLAAAIVLTSQGVPFLHLGADFLRTKQGVENSYESPDSINQIDWSRKAAYLEVFNYYQDLVA
ncbi:MAG: type I pullulanase, partial [Lewinella sp.]|nr:type I pullulanase [Lewinella sp.]